MRPLRKLLLNCKLFDRMMIINVLCLHRIDSTAAHAWRIWYTAHEHWVENVQAHVASSIRKLQINSIESCVWGIKLGLCKSSVLHVVYCIEDDVRLSALSISRTINIAFNFLHSKVFRIVNNNGWVKHSKVHTEIHRFNEHNLCILVSLALLRHKHKDTDVPWVNSVNWTFRCVHDALLYVVCAVNGVRSRQCANRRNIEWTTDVRLFTRCIEAYTSTKFQNGVTSSYHSITIRSRMSSAEFFFFAVNQRTKRFSPNLFSRRIMHKVRIPLLVSRQLTCVNTPAENHCEKCVRFESNLGTRVCVALYDRLMLNYASFTKSSFDWQIRLFPRKNCFFLLTIWIMNALREFCEEFRVRKVALKHVWKWRSRMAFE